MAEIDYNDFGFTAMDADELASVDMVLNGGQPIRGMRGWAIPGLIHPWQFLLNKVHRCASSSFVDLDFLRVMGIGGECKGGCLNSVPESLPEQRGVSGSQGPTHRGRGCGKA